MNPMIRRAIRTVFASLALAAIAIAVAGPALASHVIVSTTAPAEVTVGEVLRIPIALRAADGGPLRGTSVTFYLHASFAGVTGEAEIGRAVTDETRRPPRDPDRVPGPRRERGRGGHHGLRRHR